MTGIATRALETAYDLVPRKLRDTLYLRAFALWKVPLIAWVRPVVEELDDERCVVRVPLRRRTINHVDSMYIAVFAVGADVAGGLLAMRFTRMRRSPVVPIFKDFNASFLVRAEGDVFFTCEQGAALRAAVDEAAESGKRVNLPLEVIATVPSKRGDEPVARMQITISLKRSDRR